jgi:hypothetical protein
MMAAGAAGVMDTRVGDPQVQARLFGIAPHQIDRREAGVADTGGLRRLRLGAGRTGAGMMVSRLLRPQNLRAPDARRSRLLARLACGLGLLGARRIAR